MKLLGILEIDSLDEELTYLLNEITIDDRKKYEADLIRILSKYKYIIESYDDIEKKLTNQREKIRKLPQFKKENIINEIDRVISLANLHKSGLVRNINRVYEYLGNPIIKSHLNKKNQ
jgi:hypothetical protein